MASRKEPSILILLCLASFLHAARPVHAAWQKNGVPICTAFPFQSSPMIVSDGAHGAIIAWMDMREGEDSIEVYVQRVASSGNVLWTTDGIGLGVKMDGWDNYGSLFDAIPDGIGGIIVSVSASDYFLTNRDDYVINVDGGGITRWIVDPRGDETSRFAVTAVAGNVFIASSYSDSVCVQKIDTGGNVTWTKEWAYSEPRGEMSSQQVSIIGDGSGGIIVSWHEGESAQAQRLNADGAALWSGTGVRWADAYSYGDVALASDGTGGFIALFDFYGPYPWNFKIAQRVDASGALPWDSLGVLICPYSGETDIITSESNGVIFSVEHDGDIFLQKVDRSGDALWTTDGVYVGSSSHDNESDSHHARIASDGAGGAVVAWHARDGYDIYSQNDIIIQRVDLHGDIMWAPSGVEAIDTTRNQINPEITADGSGGVILTWEDGRDILPHIYAARFDASGEKSIAGFSTPDFALAGANNYPNPFNPSTTIAYSLNRKERVALDIYDVSGRRIINLLDDVEDEGAHSVVWNGIDANGKSAGSGVYFYRIRAGGEVISRKIVLVR